MRYIAFTFFVLITCAFFTSQQAVGQSPYGSNPYWDNLQHNSVVSAPGNYYPYVIARPADRAVLQQTPMEFRPNRPLHFWGNTVRRRTGVSTGFAGSGFPTRIVAPYQGGVTVTRISNGLVFRR